MLNQILLGDCYELMKGIPDGSVDLILTDPPYNTTALSWDQRPTDLATLWDEIKRITKPNAAIVFTASQPFTTDLPTQKPVALFEYLIRTYTNPDETILDPFAGSGTTALAAHATGRQFICIEKERKYWEIANKRLALAQMQGRFEEMVG
jgi:DNA modification methylase